MKTLKEQLAERDLFEQETIKRMEQNLHMKHEVEWDVLRFQIENLLYKGHKAKVEILRKIGQESLDAWSAEFQSNTPISPIPTSLKKTQ